MRTVILNKLEEIASTNDIKILYACESGSRGWGIPSPDSDYDVRFIYLRPLSYYLAVQEGKYDLGFPINDVLDIHGWDLRKVLQLLRKSNTTPFEWLQSPIVYRQEPYFRDDLWALCQHFFSERGNAHHYLGIAQSTLDTVTAGDSITIKKLFYVLRPLLAAKWCVERNVIAPMEMSVLMEILPGHLNAYVQDLINWKADTAEGCLVKMSAELRIFIATEFERLTGLTACLLKQEFEVQRLNNYFLDILQQYHDDRGNETKRLAAAGMPKRQ